MTDLRLATPDAAAPPDCEDDVCALPGATATRPTTAPVSADVALPSDDWEAWQAFAEERRWGDGLPLVPPTRERVEATLERFHGSSIEGQDVTLLTVGRPAR